MTNDSELGCSYMSLPWCFAWKWIVQISISLQFREYFNKVKTFLHNKDNLQLDLKKSDTILHIWGNILSLELSVLKSWLCKSLSLSSSAT